MNTPTKREVVRKAIVDELPNGQKEKQPFTQEQLNVLAMGLDALIKQAKDSVIAASQIIPIRIILDQFASKLPKVTNDNQV